ncbi:MAG: type 4 pilus major pilin [Alphaproteobacteria bacterium]
MYLNKNDQTGRSMVEMLGVLAIIGVLSVGGIAGYSKAMTKFKISKTMDQLSMIVANIRTMFSSQSSYDGLSTTTAISLGLIPDEMQLSSSTANNAFQGNVVIQSTTGDASGGVAENAADSRAFTVTYGSIGKDVCITLITSDWGTGTSSGLIGIGVEEQTTSNEAVTTAVATGWKKNSAGELPVSPIGATSLCKEYNTISWEYF